MKVFTGIILFLSFPMQVFAGEATIRASDVLSAVSGYQDSIYFKAVLVKGEEDADLYIFTGRDDESRQAIYAQNIAITGIGGVDAQLKRTQSGALQIISENSAIGRHRWERTLTIVYRDNQFIVGGYTYNYYDALEVDKNGNIKTGQCDLNLLTGSGIKDGHPIRATMKAISAQNWTVDTFPPECTSD